MLDHPDSIPRLESDYLSLRESLGRLGDILLHANNPDDIRTAFHDSLLRAQELFHQEELEFETIGCSTVEANRNGHRKFIRDLGSLLHEYGITGAGIPLASEVRKTLLPWLHEHHRLIDQQLSRRRAAAFQ